MTAAESGEYRTPPRTRATSSTRTTPEESGLIQVGGVVVLTGPALKADLECVLIAIRQRKMSGLPYQTYEALACELLSAMSASGQSDVRLPAVSEPVPVELATVPLAEAAKRLGMSARNARRIAPQLGGRKVGGRHFVDETALREHLEGR